MLTIHIITVGRDKDRWVSDQIEHFRKLLSKYTRVELTTIPEAKYGKGVDIKRALATEGDAIESRLKGGYLFILDVEGNPFSTEQMARKIEKLQVDGHSLLEFVIGGPYGLSPALKLNRQKTKSCVLNISPMTLSHQITRLVLMEQLYRVLNLNAGGTYHK
jgi:23S rRNA (pseudouridine1915-N3)-methyltransferase